MTETIEMKRYVLQRILTNNIKEIKKALHNPKLEILTSEELSTIVNGASCEELNEATVIFYIGNADIYRFEHSATYNENQFVYKDVPEVKKTVTSAKVVRPVLTDMSVGFKRKQTTHRTQTGQMRDTSTSDNCKSVFDVNKLHVIETYEMDKTVKEHPSYHYKEDSKVYLHIYIPESRIR